jgi:SPP1 gp7 family putative phage head morphogenesis protein
MATIRFDPQANREQSRAAFEWAGVPLEAPKKRRKPLNFKRRVGRLPPQRQPDTQRLGYYRELRAIVKRMHAAVEKEIVPKLAGWLEQTTTDATHLDAGSGDKEREARATIRNLGKRFAAELDTSGKLEPMVRRYARATSEFQKGELIKQLRAGIGIAPEVAEPWLTRSIANFTAENVSLIVTIPARYFAQLEDVVGEGVGLGTRAEVLMGRIQERADVSDSNARRIANDQIGKFFGQLNETRQTELGITKYVWHSVRDNRVRDEHQDRDGEVYSWDDPPGDPLDPARGGHPGIAINCRCWSEPDLSGLLESL